MYKIEVYNNTLIFNDNNMKSEIRHICYLNYNVS